MYGLEVLSGHDKGETFFLNKRELTIGREKDNDVVILDPNISRRHGRFEVDQNSVIYYDLGSKNGSKLKGNLILKLQLHLGDVLELGKSHLKLVEVGNGAIEKKDETFIFSEKSLLFKSYEELIKQQMSKHDRIYILSEFSNKINAVGSSSKLPQTIIDSLFETFNSSHGILFRYNDKEQSIQPLTARDRKRILSDPKQVGFSYTILNDVIQKKVSILVSDISQNTDLSQQKSILANKMFSVMCAPLVVNEKVVGVVQIDNRENSNKFSQEDLEVFTICARQAALAMHNIELNEHFQNEKRIRNNLARYFSPRVVEHIISAQPEILLQGKKYSVTLLVADICGFTAISEKLKPDQVVRLLNDFYDLLTGIIFRYEGTVDKYIGDCVFAVFGFPIAAADDALRAVQCANEIKVKIGELNKKRQEKNFFPIDIRMGINSGDVVAGNVGSLEQMSHTIIGDAVNSVFRINDFAGVNQIVLSKNTYDLLNNKVQTKYIGPIKVKNKEEPIVIYEVL